jgi:hypothetical protein
MSSDPNIITIDALLKNGQSALTDLEGASPGRGHVTSRPAYGHEITPGDVVRHCGTWMAVTEAAHKGILGLTYLAMIDAAGAAAFHTMVCSDVIDRRTDARIDPETLYKLCDRSCAARYVRAAHSPGAAGDVPDEQLAAWLEGAHETSLDDGRISDLHDVARIARRAVQALDEHGATHLIRDVAVWTLDDGTGEALVTVDRPGLRLATFTIRPGSFQGHTYREALAGLLAIARTEVARLDALAVLAARAQDPALTEALAEADAALAGDSDDGGQQGLRGLAEAVRRFLDGTAVDGILLTRRQLHEWAGLGRDLTAGEMVRLAGCIPRSTIPGSIGTIAIDALRLAGAGGLPHAGGHPPR